MCVIIRKTNIFEVRQTLFWTVHFGNNLGGNIERVRISTETLG